MGKLPILSGERRERTSFSFQVHDFSRYSPNGELACRFADSRSLTELSFDVAGQADRLGWWVFD